MNRQELIGLMLILCAVAVAEIPPRIIIAIGLAMMGVALGLSGATD